SQHERNTFVIGFGAPDSGAQACQASTLHRALFAAEPHLYFRESLLMLYVLAELGNGNGNGYAEPLADRLSRAMFNTPLGVVSFDQGECQNVSTRLWALGPAGLYPAI
ncbi:hypothetical protein A245_07224, partial [Pseudomonas syringae pv. actinidiae ICMP 19096]